MSKELKKGKRHVAGMDSGGLNSSHQMAAEATVRKMKNFLKNARINRLDETLP
jgi:hypothetical protein